MRTVSVSTGSRLLTNRQWHDIALSLSLSPRELQLVRYVFDDLGETGIALALGTSRHTVHSQFGRLYIKLGVNSRTALVVRVIEEYINLRDSAARAHVTRKV